MGWRSWVRGRPIYRDLCDRAHIRAHVIKESFDLSMRHAVASSVTRCMIQLIGATECSERKFNVTSATSIKQTYCACFWVVRFVCLPSEVCLPSRVWGLCRLRSSARMPEHRWLRHVAFEYRICDHPAAPTPWSQYLALRRQMTCLALEQLEIIRVSDVWSVDECNLGSYSECSKRSFSVQWQGVVSRESSQRWQKQFLTND